jgi:hypothetical protein
MYTVVKMVNMGTIFLLSFQECDAILANDYSALLDYSVDYGALAPRIPDDKGRTSPPLLKSMQSRGRRTLRSEGVAPVAGFRATRVCRRRFLET